ncbi:MAG: cardiolipin synthase [Pseudomonadota bacterium]|nr:cardiolipin synthase [Pseudomonadota bacterium]
MPDHLLHPGLAGLLFIAHLLTVARALTRRNRTPASRAAWVAVIMLAPLLGVVGYWLLGETSIGRGRVRRIDTTQKALPRAAAMPGGADSPLPAVAAWAHESAQAVFALAHSINGFAALPGNRISLLGDAEGDPRQPQRDCLAAIDTLLVDIANARDSVHIAVYIWLDDALGARLVDAVAAAARRGVACRVMVDALGSRAFSHGPHWQRMSEAGVKLLRTLDDINRLRHLAFSRLDLRDHRKLVVIDNRIGYCGSQNFAAPAFEIKPKFAPWIDLLFRCEGPLVRQMQYLFLSGWIPETDEPGLERLPVAEPLPRCDGGSIAQVFETGPTSRHNAMSDMFVAAINAACRELLITTPYFVPDEALLRALCAAPRRGVRTRIVFPARNDSWLVGQACRSTWAELLECGVEVFEYPLGLLHAKSLTCDDSLALVGSANMDRRSLELNFENNLLIADANVVAALRARQLGYLSVCRAVDADEVRAWPFHQRLIQNAVAMASPVL